MIDWIHTFISYSKALKNDIQVIKRYKFTLMGGSGERPSIDQKKFSETKQKRNQWIWPNSKKIHDSKIHGSFTTLVHSSSNPYMTDAWD